MKFAAAALIATASLVSAAATATGQSGGIVATHNGQTRNLATEGWGSAKTCISSRATGTRCFDSIEDADAYIASVSGSDPGLARRAAPSSCASGWACIYDNDRYGGRKLQWSDRGTHNLADWGFNDKVTSAYNNRNKAIVLTNVRPLWPDKSITIPAKTGNSNVGGDFNDTADRIELK
ncbi:hypothetical protein HDU86_008482 [Geranomyces michiganensis]|nr:hypothetical protein HDU86_008482 [Geranomyces michiganensis]